MQTLSKFTFVSLLSLWLLVAGVRGGLPEQGALEGDPIAGGQVYDNWMVALDEKPPDGDQPLWEEREGNPRAGQVTWRCATCHGWDLKGEDGAYDTNSINYTGFPGLQSTVGASQADVISWLDGTNNPKHDFLQYTNIAAMNDLAAFLRTQQLDLALIIDYQTRQSFGDELAGRDLYEAACGPCHGARGDQIDFSPAGGMPLFIGDLADEDPWRTVHKIRFGQPASRMPASEELSWSLSKVADVLAYSQSLPRGNAAYSLTTDAPGSVNIERQGDIEPIIWAAAAILLVIGVSLGWDRYQQRGS